MPSLFRYVRPGRCYLPVLLALGGLLVNTSRADESKPPNIVFILADDLGYGDISCEGATAIPTPNIDRLAREGLRFTDGHAEAATCTPSRYSLMTGQYAWRKPGTNILPGDANVIIPPGSPTLPSVLKQAGYATGIIGKWHLGLGSSKINWNADIKPGPLELGFDYEFLMPATLDRVPCVFLERNRVDKLDPADPIEVNYQHRVGNDPTGFTNPEMLRYKADAQHSGTIINGVSRIGYMSGGHAARWSDEGMPDLLTAKATGFIEANKDQPFFLYYAAPEPHVPRIPNPRFVGKTTLGPRGDVVVQLDWGVGQIMATLDRLHLTENTLVIFSSDNGPVLNDGYMDGSVVKRGSHLPAGPYRGGKYDAFEGGTRVPLIVRWPARIKPGLSHAMVCQMDLPATLAALTKQTMEKTAFSDSVNVLPALLGESTTGRTALVEQGSAALGLRDGDWKLVQPNGGKHPAHEKFEAVAGAQLFHLTDDPGERHDLAKDNPPKLAEMQAELAKIRGPGAASEVDDPKTGDADD